MIWKDNSLSVGFFLASRDIKRGNIWTNILIIFVMTLTFFNMILLGGILNGVAQGQVSAIQQYYSGNIFIIPATTKNSIEQTDAISNVVKSLPTFKAESVRYTGGATLEYGYQNKIRQPDISESVQGTLVGINPKDEDSVSQLSQKMIAGSYLTQTDANAVIIGANLLQAYNSSRGGSVGVRILKTAKVGSKLLLIVNGIQEEVILKGVFKSGNDTVDSRMYMVDTQTRQLLGATDLNANEIAVSLSPNASADEAKQYILKNLGNNQNIVVQTGIEALPSGVANIFKTFALLGNMIGAIAITVGAITIFIVIYVNAITRRKFIGILKGIGISSQAIQASYMFQALFYALSGILIGSILLSGFLIPFFAVHPIQLPIASVQLDVSITDMVIRAIILTIVALVSGFIPARIVTKQNTLDAILGR